MRKFVNGVYIEMQPDEIASIRLEQMKVQMQEKSRPMTEAEVSRMLIANQINSLVVDDNTALRMLEFYPEWEENTAYSESYKVRQGGKLWRVVQAHTSQGGWEPENAASLWTQVNETHAGTMDDPIPYEGNMALEDGKRYVQDYEVYRCFRDTVNPVYHHLDQLVGLYVERM